MHYIKQIFLSLSTCIIAGCGGSNTTTPLASDITSIHIDTTTKSFYPTDAKISLHATANYTDGTTKDVSTYVIWSESNSSLVNMVANTLAVKSNGGESNLSIQYADFQDTTPIHIHKLTVFHTIYPDDVNTTGEYIFKAEGDFDNNETNRTLITNIHWYATNDATIDVDEDGIAHITLIAGETNVTTTVFNDNNATDPLPPQSKIFNIN